MPRRWTEHQPRAANILDADGFNAAYDAYKGEINGGIDRTMLEENAVDHPVIKDNALIKVVVSNNLELATDYQVSNGGICNFQCLDYDNYTGGWITNTEVTFTGLREGMLHVEFSCWAFHQKIQTYNNPKYSRWQLTWNNQVICQTAEIYTHFSNPYLVADVPVAGGSGVLGVRWQYAGVDAIYDSTTANQFMFGGGNLYIQGVWR